MNAMYNLLQECSEEKGWQKPTIETIQGNFRTLEYIIWLETKLDHYKRLAEAAEDVIMEQDGHCTSDLYYARFDIWENIKNERMEDHHEG